MFLFRTSTLLFGLSSVAGLALACSAGSSDGGSGTGGTDTGGSASGGAASGGRGSGGDTSGGATAPGGASGAGGASSGAGGGAGGPALGGNCSVFPAGSAWNLDVSGLAVHGSSDAMVDSIGRTGHVHPDFGTEWEGAPIGIPYVLVDGSQALVDITYDAYGAESDPGPFPIPLDAPIEGGPQSDGDRHVLAVDVESCTLYELYSAYPEGNGWRARSGVEFDLTRNDHHPEGCTSADAAGLPIFPGLVRYDEVVLEGEIRHALRFTVSRSRQAYIFPARHYASSDTSPDLPAMGQRLRMKAGYDCSGYSTEAQVVCQALKKYGMLLADNGSDWYISGAPDPRWDDEALGDLKQIPGDAFEVVDTGDAPVTESPDCSL